MMLVLARAAMVSALLLVSTSFVASAAETATTAAPKPASIDGFRSAKFGMDEDAVRKAITTDFALKDDKVHRDVHPSEKTTVLTIAVADLLPDTGPAVVSYILGYHSQKLSQVNVVWPQAKDINLGSAALTLRNYFTALQFPPNATVVDGQLPNGNILAFRGTDQKGRMVMVLFQPPPATEGKDKDKAAKADAAKAPEAMLRLSYVETPDKPDVFTLKPGQF